MKKLNWELTNRMIMDPNERKETPKNIMYPKNFIFLMPVSKPEVLLKSTQEQTLVEGRWLYLLLL